MSTAAIARWVMVGLVMALGMAGAHAQEEPGLEEAQQVRERAEPLAEQGDANAQYNMGVLYDGGYGVEQDHDIARGWYEKAAAQEYAKAEHNLGVMYQEGRGVQPNPEEAARWFKRAAEHGEAAAQNNLAVLYVRGQGVPQDLSRAAFWAASAAEAGNPSAISNLPQIIEELPSARIDGDSVNIRTKPNRSGRVIRQADLNARVVLLDTRDDWSQVLFPDDYAVGWVANFLLTDGATAQAGAPAAASETPDVAGNDAPSTQQTDNAVAASANTAAGAADAEDGSQNDGAPVEITGSVVNIRERATTSSEVLFQVRQGEPATVIDRQGDWRRVRFEDGRIGWVAGFLLTAAND